MRVTGLPRLAVAALLAILLAALPAGAATHPLDALDAAEIAAAAALLRAAGHAGDATVFHTISLEEPPKEAVLAWKEGEPISRAAALTVRDRGATYEAVVDLTARRVVSFDQVPGAQPMIVLPELLAAQEIALADPRMQEGLRQRGVIDLTQLFCAPRTAGNFGRLEERERRIVKVDCFDIRGVTTNVFATPIEGLFATVDLDSRQVVEVTDLGVVPIPPGEHDFDPATLGRLRDAKPVVQIAPLGSNVEIDGSMVRWQSWSFHLRWDMRAGAVVSLVTYHDQGRPRSILYQGSLSEIFVPYQDPTVGWYFRNYMDEGEYGIGTTVSPLQRGSDCPADAAYLPVVMGNAAGGADTLEDRVCVFERALAQPVWRHFDIVTEALESRPGTELVVRAIATVGNYDYAFDWVLDTGGAITFRGGATGIDGVKGVRATSLADPSAAEDTAWGALIAPGRVGINHDHFFSIRLDFDVDGPKNRFVRDVIAAQRMPETSPRRSLWHMHSEVAKTETEAQYRLSYEQPAMWRVESSEATNALGYPSSYMLHAEGNALPLVDEDDAPLARARFATRHLWVTPYAPDERWAAGDYPNQSEPGQGLPAWTAQGRSVEDTDIVLWYTLGFHHMPSAEDWPVYNLGWHSLTLKPYNFFDRNPALDVAPVAEPAAQPSSGGSG
ncbi:MAG TPA: tyramine oxidase [Thermoanaerobaculia bacterium]|nr:tyramine oxidase [Thermoanaerobaculia bacterium]